MSDCSPADAHVLPASIDADVNRDMITTVCSLLSNERRLVAVLYLLHQGTDEPTHVSELARWVTADMNEYSVEEAQGADYRSVRESLRHTHLDALAEANVIDVNTHQTQIVPGDNLPVVGRTLLHLMLVSAGTQYWPE